MVSPTPWSTLRGKRVRYAEYVTIANDSPAKYEYIAGESVAMSGGSIAYGRLIRRATDALNRALDGKRYVALSSDLRVRIHTAERATYSDLHIVCGEIERDPDGDRGGDGRRWYLEEYGAGERMTFDSLAIALVVEEIYVDRIGPIIG